MASDSSNIQLDRSDLGVLLDRVREPVILVGNDVVPILFNEAARELDLWLSKEPDSQTLDLEYLVLALRRTLLGHPQGQPLLTSIELTSAAGETRFYAVTVSAQKSDRDVRTRYLVILTQTEDSFPHSFDADKATELETVHARLKDVQAKLLQSDKLASLGQLAAGVAHEINNPIGYIHSNLGTLQEYISNLFNLIDTYEAFLREAQTARSEHWTEIENLKQRIDYAFLVRDLPLLLTESREGVERVRKIVQDLRDFSHAGHADHWKLADIHHGLDSTLNIVWNELKYKAEVSKQYGTLPLVECLPSQLNQVFMNILVNAGHAIEKRGTITITTRELEKSVQIEISDTGKGIDKANLGRIFDPFFTTKSVGHGTGLGLSLSYGIVRKHGGQIDVRSEVDKGTTFLITLPLRRPASAAESPATEPGTAG